MRLVAQRVLRIAGEDKGASGINAYCYLGEVSGSVDTAAARLIQVKPGGNRVRSYLEIDAADGMSPAVVAASVDEGSLQLAAARSPLPWKFSHGDVAFEFALEASLADQWRLELRLLVEHCFAALAEASPRSPGFGGIFD